MLVRVSFLGILRDLMGTARVDLELPEQATFRDLLNALGPEVEDRLPSWAWDSERGGFSDRMMVSRGGSTGMPDTESPLSDGEEILVFPPLAGG